MRVFAFAFAVGSTILGGLAHAATLSSYTSKEHKDIIILNGDIAEGDTEQLQRLVKKANDEGRLVSGVRLNSTGGALLEGAKLADAIRFAKIASVVPNGSTCASACFLAFAAGSEKYASYSARVGVHGASEKGGQETNDSRSATVTMAKISKELGVSATIIGKMVVTPPDQIVWLTPDDLRTLGTTMTGKPTQVAPPEVMAGRPQQVPPNITAAVTPAPKKDWSSVFSAAFDRSAAQNNGKPDIGRACQPEFKICTTALYIKGNDGNRMMMRMAEDMNGKVVTRDICQFNAFGDVRTCIDWDTGATSRDMKDVKGLWTQVGDK